MGMLEQTRAHEALDLRPEELLLDPLGAHHCRGEHDEGRRRSRAPLVDHPSSDFLSHPRRTGDEHTASRRSYPLQRRPHGVDGDRAALELVLRADLRLQRDILASQAVGFGRTPDEIDQPFRLKWLLDKVDGPFPHRGDSRV